MFGNMVDYTKTSKKKARYYSRDYLQSPFFYKLSSSRCLLRFLFCKILQNFVRILIAGQPRSHGHALQRRRPGRQGCHERFQQKKRGCHKRFQEKEKTVQQSNWRFRKTHFGRRSKTDGETRLERGIGPGFEARRNFSSGNCKWKL